MAEPTNPHLLLCDACCDKAGILKEAVKTGGCTCDICGWACKCCGDDGKQFVNRVAVLTIPDDAWPELQARNHRSLKPLDWQELFLYGREDG